MNRSPSPKKASPPVASFTIPERKTAEAIAAESESVQKANAVSETPVAKAMKAAGKTTGAAGEGKGRAKENKPASDPAPAAEKAVQINYEWLKDGMNVEKVFSNRLPAGLLAKMNFLVGMDSSLKVGKIVAAAVEPVVDKMLKERGITW